MLFLSHEKRIGIHFREVHPDAYLAIDLQRTLRVPDDGRDYPLPPGLGSFPLEHVDDHAERVPADWLGRGGLLMPMHQSEAVWLKFKCTDIKNQGQYPFAIKIGTGKINALTGRQWDAWLNRSPQDYVVAPEQPWLDGYSVGTGAVRQFVAMPMGKGYSVEEQITGQDKFGGIQIQAYPMKRAVFEKRFLVQEPSRGGSMFSLYNPLIHGDRPQAGAKPDLGVAPGGRITQQIFKDEFDPDDWDLTHSSRCFIHLCNSLQWRALTGKKPPTKPNSPREYRKAGLPWFNYYKEKARVLDGSAKLAGLDTVADHARTHGDLSVSDSESIAIEKVIELRRSRRDGQVRESDW